MIRDGIIHLPLYMAELHKLEVISLQPAIGKMMRVIKAIIGDYLQNNLLFRTKIRTVRLHFRAKIGIVNLLFRDRRYKTCSILERMMVYLMQGWEMLF